MRKEKLLLFSLITLLMFTKCTFLEDVSNPPEKNVDNKEFIFKNYTDNQYLNTKISVGKVVDNTITNYHSEYLETITSKGMNAFSEVTTEKREQWDFYLSIFMDTAEDLGCFIIEFSDERKIFIEIKSYEDGIFYGLEIPDLFEIEIHDDEILTELKTDVINGIPVEEYEIFN